MKECAVYFVLLAHYHITINTTTVGWNVKFGKQSSLCCLFIRIYHNNCCFAVHYSRNGEHLLPSKHAKFNFNKKCTSLEMRWERCLARERTICSRWSADSCSTSFHSCQWKGSPWELAGEKNASVMADAASAAGTTGVKKCLNKSESVLGWMEERERQCRMSVWAVHHLSLLFASYIADQCLYECSVQVCSCCNCKAILTRHTVDGYFRAC